MRRRYGTISRLMIIILALNLMFPTSGSVSVLAAAKAPKLSKASKIIEIKKGFKLKIKKNKAKKIIKTKWSLTKKSKSLVSLLNKKKKSVRVLAFDVVGEAKVKAKVTYQMGSKTKTKTMKCKVFIQDTSPVTPAPDIDFTYTPAASSTPAPASSSAPAVKGTLTFNANSNMFEIAFAEAVQCAYNPDSTDTSGNKEWTTSAGAVASIFWSGVTAYYVPVTKAVLSSDGMKMSIYVDPGPLRVGARFDATVTGLYRMGGTPNNSKSTYSMTGLVDSLQAAVDTKLIQPFIGDSNTVCLSVYFNQPMRNQVAYDVTPSVTPSPTPTATPTPGVTSRPAATVTPTPVAELGKWTNNAASVAAMYETAGGATSNVSSSISSVTAYRSANDPGIERLVIDTGSSVSTGTKEYVLALSGFSPNNSSGIAAGNTLNANLKYTTETLGSNSSSYMVHNQGSVINGEATDVVLQINIINAKGNGTLYKQSNTKDKGIPSDYVAVSDANNSNLPVTFLKSNFNSNTVEIGISGGRDQTKFNVKFAPQFPRKFLVTGPNQLITCDNTIAVVAAGTSSSSTPAPAGSVDTATYDTAAGCFTIPFTKAYKWRLSPDEGTDSTEKKYYHASAAGMASFYEANVSSGQFDRTKSLDIAPLHAVLSSDGKKLQLFVDKAKLALNKRYAIALSGFQDASTGADFVGAEYLATVKSLTAPIAVKSADTYFNDGSPVIDVTLSDDFAVDMAYDYPAGDDYEGQWLASASKVAEVYRLYPEQGVSSMDSFKVFSVYRLKGEDHNKLKIIIDPDNPITESATYRIVLKGIKVSSSNSSDILCYDKKIEVKSMTVGSITAVSEQYFPDAPANSTVTVTLSGITPGVDTSLSSSSLLSIANECIGITKENAATESIKLTSVSATSDSLVLTIMGNINTGAGLNVFFTSDTPYLLLNITDGSFYSAPKETQTIKVS